jgi:hypothetical protein
MVESQGVELNTPGRSRGWGCSDRLLALIQLSLVLRNLIQNPLGPFQDRPGRPTELLDP